MKTLKTLDLPDLEKIVEKGQKTFVEVGDALTEIRDRKLYKKDYDTFEAYCQQRWGWSRRRGNQLIEAASVVESLPPNLGTAVPNEAVARELKKLPLPVRKEVVEESKKTGEPLTAPAVKKHFPPPPVRAPAPPSKPPVRPTPPMPVKPVKPPEPDEVKDKTGWTIPRNLVELWERAPEAQELLTAISRVKGVLKKAQDGKDKLFSEINFSSALAHLDQAYTDLKTALPFAVCPTCQGKGGNSCALCKGRGFISQFKWDSVVPRETKDLRNKVKK